MSTILMPEERALLRKIHEQGWGIDECGLSIYRDIDGDAKHLTTDFDGPEEVARELARVWQSAWPIVVRLETAIKAAEACTERAEASLQEALAKQAQMAAGIEKIAAANHLLAERAQQAEAEVARLTDGLPRALAWKNEPPMVAGDCYVRTRPDESEPWDKPFVVNFSESYLKELYATPLIQYAGPIPLPLEG